MSNRQTTLLRDGYTGKAITFTQTVLDNIEYTFDYSNWLALNETIISISSIIDLITVPPVLAGNFSINPGATSANFFVSGGISGQLGKIRILGTTSLGQVREDIFFINVIDPLVVIPPINLTVINVLAATSDFNAMMLVYINGLPTALPATPGVMWMDGGVLSRS